MRIAVVVPTFRSASMVYSTVRRLIDTNSCDFDVIIVDGGSEDWRELRTMFRGLSNVFILRHPIDLGGAGSFRVGVKFAFDNGYHYVVLADGDAAPLDNDLICRLVEKAEEESSATFPKHVLVDVFGSWFESMRYTSMHFLTVPRWVIGRVGFPSAWLFIRGDDWEFSSRIVSVLGREIVVVDKRFIHPIYPPDRLYALEPKIVYGLRNSLYLTKIQLVRRRGFFVFVRKLLSLVNKYMNGLFGVFFVKRRTKFLGYYLSILRVLPRLNVGRLPRFPIPKIEFRSDTYNLLSYRVLMDRENRKVQEIKDKLRGKVEKTAPIIKLKKAFLRDRTAFVALYNGNIILFRSPIKNRFIRILLWVFMQIVLGPLILIQTLKALRNASLSKAKKYDLWIDQQKFEVIRPIGVD